MSKVSQYPPGTFCWVDLATNNPEKAKEFYIGLFGWEVDDRAMEEGVYSIMRKDGQDVAAIASSRPMTEDAPSMWNSYVNVESVDASAARVKELAGKILAPPMDMMTAGRMAVVADPEGVAFALWQAGEHRGAELINEPNTFAWNELYTRDIDQAVNFYSRLFGWKHKIHQMPDGRIYHMFSVENRDRAGMLEITPDMRQKRPTWLVYFTVADLEEAHNRTMELGGKADLSPDVIPTVGTLIGATDPVGARFYLLKVFREPEPL